MNKIQSLRPGFIGEIQYYGYSRKGEYIANCSNEEGILINFVYKATAIIDVVRDARTHVSQMDEVEQDYRCSYGWTKRKKRSVNTTH